MRRLRFVERYGRLVVLMCRSGQSPHYKRQAYVRCDCGVKKWVNVANLKKGTTKSCGCRMRQINRERMTSHGKARTPTYYVWKSMLARCNNPKQPSYADYGGRGIKVCTRWHQFENFLEDMGEVPEGFSLDRVDNDRGYSLGNCRWATRSEQSCNRRSRIRSGHTLVKRGRHWVRVSPSPSENDGELKAAVGI